MKIMQIYENKCYRDMTNEFPTLESTYGKFAPYIIIVEAPDYVLPGWSFDESLTGDERFIAPPVIQDDSITDNTTEDDSYSVDNTSSNTTNEDMTLEEKLLLLQKQVEEQKAINEELTNALSEITASLESNNSDS